MRINVLFILFFGLSLSSVLQAQPFTDLQILALRVGPSFDANELEYFGLFAKGAQKVDSARYGTVANAFYIEPFSKGKSERVVLSPATQNEFVQYIGLYERFAQDSRSLDTKLLFPLGVSLPLRRYEKNGFMLTAISKSGKQIYGEVVRIEGTKILLYDLDIGYDAQLSPIDILLVDADTLAEIDVYRRNVAKFTGLITGTAIALGALGAGFSPFVFATQEAQAAGNILAFAGGGFLIGFVLDQLLSYKSHFVLSKPRELNRALALAKRRQMFPTRLPPELERKLAAGR